MSGEIERMADSYVVDKAVKVIKGIPGRVERCKAGIVQGHTMACLRFYPWIVLFRQKYTLHLLTLPPESAAPDAELRTETRVKFYNGNHSIRFVGFLQSSRTTPSSGVTWKTRFIFGGNRLLKRQQFLLLRRSGLMTEL